jgi:hypothetical protein
VGADADSPGRSWVRRSSSARVRAV